MQKETVMRERFSGSMLIVAISAAAAVVSVSIDRTSAQAPARSATTPTPAAAPKTPWGEPDLQGIWTDETDIPLRRPAEYSNQEFFTETQREEIVNGSYNSVLLSVKRIGARTSKIIDPPNGRLLSLTPEARKAAAADRDFYLALLQATETCKNKAVGCIGGKYDLAGRVFKSVPAPYNLPVPPYHFISDRSVRIGENPPNVTRDFGDIQQI
jgi:hypothetical protein